MFDDTCATYIYIKKSNCIKFKIYKICSKSVKILKATQNVIYLLQHKLMLDYFIFFLIIKNIYNILKKAKSTLKMFL